MFKKPSKQRSVLLGGLIIGAISGIPGINLINCCCCAGILLGGAMSVYLYRQEFTDDMPPLESSDALILGIISGIIGAVITTAISTLITFTFGSIDAQLMFGFLEKIFQKLEERGTLPPDAMDQMREKFEDALREGHSVGGILRSLIYALILYPIFSMLGGLIGFGIFGKKKPTSVPPTQQL